MAVSGSAHDGRWNTSGFAITYCATGPALCVLEKLVHEASRQGRERIRTVDYAALTRPTEP